MVEECETLQEIILAYPLLHQLRPTLSLEEYLELVEECQRKGNYQIFVWKIENRMMGFCGVMPMPTLYYDHCLWICDLVVDESLRSKGIGEKFLVAIEEWATANGYHEICLSSGIARADAHRFYTEKMGYDKVSYVFKKNL